MDPFRSVSNDSNHPSSPDSRAASTNPFSAVVPTLNTNRYKLSWQIPSIPPPFINTNNFAASYNTDINQIPPESSPIPTLNNFDTSNYPSYVEEPTYSINEDDDLYQIPRPQSSPIPSYSDMIPPSTSTNHNLADPNHPIVTAASTPVVPNDINDLDQDSEESPSPPRPSFPLNISLNLEGPQRTSLSTSTNCNYPIFTTAASSGVPNYNSGLCDVPLQPSPIPLHPFSYLNIHPSLNQAPLQPSPIPPHPFSYLNIHPSLNQAPLQPSPIPLHPFSYLNIHPGLNQAPLQRSVIPPHPSYEDVNSSDPI